MRKATYANGVVQYYDENAHSPGTHYSGADGNAHPIVSDVEAADSEEARFEDVATPLPAASEPASGDFVPAG